jgi:hypothetical protein
VCLLAAGAWLRLVDGCPREARRRSWAAFGAVTVAAALILPPLQAWQTRAYVRPYAAAARAIAGTDADVVLMNGADVWFGEDLVRNDPFLRNRPKVMYLPFLDDRAVRGLCARGKVALFDVEDARRFGIRTSPEVGAAPGRRRLAAVGCRPARVAP